MGLEELSNEIENNRGQNEVLPVGIQLLESDLVNAKFSTTDRQKDDISMFSQLLALQVDQVDAWKPIADLIRRHMQDAQQLVQCLKNISQDIQLAQMIMKLRLPGFSENVVSLLYDIRAQPAAAIGYKKMRKLLADLMPCVTLDENLLLALGQRLVSIVAQEVPAIPEILLWQILQLCCYSGADQQQPFRKIATFFDELVSGMQKTKKLKRETLEMEASSVWNHFVRVKLMGSVHAGDWEKMFKYKETAEVVTSLHFLLGTTLVDVQDMDAIRQWAVENSNQVDEMIQNVFRERHWDKQWKLIRQLLSADVNKDDDEQQRKLLDRLEAALDWSFSSGRQSFASTMNVLSELQKKIIDKDGRAERLVKWMEEQTVATIGSFGNDDRDDQESSKASLFSMLDQLSRETKVLDVKMWKPRITMAIYCFDTLTEKSDRFDWTAQQVEIVGRVLNKRKTLVQTIEDQSFLDDWEELMWRLDQSRLPFYLKRWTNQLDETKEIRTKCMLSSGQLLPLDEIALAKFSLFSTWLLSPEQAAEGWRSLRDASNFDSYLQVLKELQRETKQTETIDKLIGDIDEEMEFFRTNNNGLNFTKGISNKRDIAKGLAKEAREEITDSAVVEEITKDSLPSSSQEQEEEINENEDDALWFLSWVVDPLLQFLDNKETKYEDDTKRRLLVMLKKIEILLECHTFDDLKRQQESLSSIQQQLNWQWRNMLQSGESMARIPEDLRQIVLDVMDLVWKVFNQRFSFELSKRIERNERILSRSIDWLVETLQLMANFCSSPSSAIRVDKLVDSVVLHLQNGEELTLAKMANENMLMKKLVAIWNDVVPADCQIHSTNLTVEKLLDEILLQKWNPKLISLPLTVVAQICRYCDDEEGPMLTKSWEKLLSWSSRLIPEGDQLLDSLVIEIQSSLIGLCRSLHVEMRRRQTTDSANPIVSDTIDFGDYEYQDYCDRLSHLARFLSRSEIEANRLFLDGLIFYGLQMKQGLNGPADSMLSQYLSSAYLEADDEESDDDPERKFIVHLLYPKSTSEGLDQNLTSLTITEKAFLERWIQQETGIDEDSLQMMHKCLQTVSKSSSQIDENNNRLYKLSEPSSMPDFIFNDDEKIYADFAGKELVDELLLHRHPLSYTDALKEGALDALLRKLVRQYYSSAEFTDKELADALRLVEPSSTGAETNPSFSSIKADINEFSRSFRTVHSSALAQNVELEWFMWMRDVVLKSIQSWHPPGSLRIFTEFLSAAGQLAVDRRPKYDLNDWMRATTTSRPYEWNRHLLVDAICRFARKLLERDGPAQQQSASSNSQDLLIEMEMLLATKLHACLRSADAKKMAILSILRDKLEREAGLAVFETVSHEFLNRLASDLTAVEYVEKGAVGPFNDAAIRHWPKLIRRLQLKTNWSDQVASLIVNTLDRLLGVADADLVLVYFQKKFAFLKTKLEDRLHRTLKNVAKFPWMAQDLLLAATNCSTSSSSHDIWDVILSESRIKEKMALESKEELEAAQIVAAMSRDPNSRDVVGDEQSRKRLVDEVEEIKRIATQLSPISADDIKNWAAEVKSQSQPTPLDPVLFLAKACQAVQLEKNYRPRDAQLLAILIFLNGAGDETTTRNRMAQVSTGEGKTLVSALLAIYHVLANWSGWRHVNVVTSSSVLAETNIKEIQWLYDVFGVSVHNNCDKECADDEERRRKRYNNDVIYGDLSGFQRDILLTRFFNCDITRNREPGAVIVDEVDSLLLDKGENVLYLSHKIPEMDDLLGLFVDIWGFVHAPDIFKGDKDDVEQVKDLIQSQIESGATRVPRCLKSFVQRHLTTWVQNAFRARSMQVNDSFRVVDIGDGRGQQVIIMDKETGVEQVEMQWTHGLHQFLQLRFNMPPSPISLRAVFMSNMGYFDQLGRNCRLYGLTGTLGSTAECHLLSQVYNVDFFTMPRYRRRYCYEVDPLLAKDGETWLNNVTRATLAQSERAVLVVCENIRSARSIYQKLIGSAAGGSTKNIVKYDSSFDKEFQERQQVALQCGVVIVATNLAGRGADFKISETLLAEDGLHVVISYVPPNARVESQAEGRTARAGQTGSYQLVVCDPTVDDGQDPYDEMQRLKSERDRTESRRLEDIRTKGMQKIRLEEKLFRRFQSDVYDKIQKQMSVVNQDAQQALKGGLSQNLISWSVKAAVYLFDENKGNEEPTSSSNHLRDFATNKWALWFDEYGPTNNKSDTPFSLQESTKIEEEFDNFAKKWLALYEESWDVTQFASMPTEWLKLGRCFDSSKNNTRLAMNCYQSVIENEPESCEIALIHKAKLILNDAAASFRIFLPSFLPSSASSRGTSQKKEEAKRLLVRAQKMIEERTSRLATMNQVVSQVADFHRKTGVAINDDNRFEDHMNNFNRIWQVHSTAIEAVLGRSVRSSLAKSFPEEEAKELLDAIERSESVKRHCKPFRLSRKIRFEDNSRVCWIGEDKKLEWSYMWDHCRAPIEEMLKSKIKNQLFSIGLDEVEQSIRGREEAIWKVLVNEGYIESQETKIERQTIRSWDSVDDENNRKKLDQLPGDLVDRKPLLIEWLQNNGSVDLSNALESLSSVLATEEKKNSLKVFLTTEGFVEKTEEKRHRLLKKIVDEPKSLCEDDQYFALPSTIRALIPSIEALTYWFPSFRPKNQINDWVCRPTKKELRDKSHQLWLYLIDEGVIKEVVVQLRKGAAEKEVESFRKQIQTAVSSIDEIEAICRKYQPPPPEVDVDNLTLEEISLYIYHGTIYNGCKDLMKRIRANVWEKAGAVMDAIGSPVKSILTSAETLHAWTWKTTELQYNKDEIKCWLTDYRLKLQLIQYERQVADALTSSAGQLKLVPNVTASLRPLNSYFESSSRAIPTEELDAFRDRLFDRVVVVEEYKTRWEFWKPILLVVLAGLAQIALGIMFPFFGFALIGEGIGDLMMIWQSFMSGSTITWRDYCHHKVASLAMTALTLGVGVARLMRVGQGGIKEVLRIVTTMNKTMAVWKSMGMQALKRFGQALLSTTVGQVLDKFFQWLKRFILEQVVGKTNELLTFLVGDRLKKLEGTMDAVWDFMKESGKSLADAIEMIKTSVAKTAEKPTYTTWLQKVGEEISTVAVKMRECFENSSAGLATHESFLNTQGGKHAVKGDTTGCHYYNDALTVKSAHCKEETDCNGIVQVVDTAKNLIDYAKKTAQVMKWINGFIKVAALAEHGANHVDNVKIVLEEELDNLKRNSQQSNREENKSDSAAQPEPSSELSGDDEADFAKFKDDFKLEMQKKIGDHILNEIQRNWLQPLVQRKLEKVIKKVGKAAVKGIKTLIQPDDTAHAQIDLQSFFNQDDFKSGSRLDENYNDNIANMGNGKPATVVHNQAGADMFQQPIRIEDPTGFYTGNGQKSHTFYPDGNQQCKKPPIVLRFTRNADGTNHVTLVMPDGTTHEVPHNPNEPPNRCLFNALAKVKDMKTDDFLRQFKSFAATDKRAKYLYDQNCHKAYSHLNVGALTPTYIKDKMGRVIETRSDVTKKDLGTGSRFKNDERTNQNMRDKGAKPKDHKGHKIAGDFGGPADLENLSPMHSRVNQGEYLNRCERVAKEFVLTKGDIHLTVKSYYYKKEKRESGFRFSWYSEVVENGETYIYSFDSGFIENYGRPSKRREAARCVTGGFPGIKKELKSKSNAKGRRK